MQAYEARQKEYAAKGEKHFYFMTLNGSEVCILPCFFFFILTWVVFFCLCVYFMNSICNK